MPQEPTILSVRVSDRTRGLLSDRAALMHQRGEAVQAAVDLALLYDLLEHDLHRVAMTLPEALCMAAVFQATALSPAGVGALAYMEARDAFAADGYAEQFGIDATSLLARLEVLPASTDHAMLSTFARWRSEDHKHQCSADCFARLGLRLTDSVPAIPA